VVSIAIVYLVAGKGTLKKDKQVNKEFLRERGRKGV